MAKALSLFLLVCRFLAGEELPDSSAVELVTERVQDGVEDRRRLGQHRQDLEELQPDDRHQPVKDFKDQQCLFSYHSELWGNETNVLEAGVCAHHNIRTPAEQQRFQRQTCVKLQDREKKR